MGIIATILLVIFIYYVVWPIVKVALTVRRARNQARDFFNGAGQPAGAAGASGAHHRPRRQRRGKKIDPSVGEYVEFEEIRTYRATDTAAPPRPVTPESQVEDAEWEDL